MKRILLLLTLFIWSSHIFSQVANYSYTATTSTWAANVSPNSITGLGSVINDALSSTINIGFNFIYDGTTYTQFKASSNGFLTFNTSNTLAQPTNNLNTSTERTILAVLWDDDQTGASGNVNYKLTGATPNQILTVEWYKLRWNKSGYSAGTIDCQIKLYETTNVIEYIYNRGSYQSFGNSSGIGASIGLGGSTSGDFVSLSDLVVSPTKSTSTETTTIGASPTNYLTKTAGQANTSIPNGTKYRFTPPPTIITSGSLSAFTSCSGYVSSEQSYNVSGFGLTANITITAPTGFELSTTSGSGFTSPLTLTQSSGIVSSTTVYVRLKTTATGSPSGNITNASTSATTKNVAASGTVTTSVTPSVSVSGTSSICSGTSVTFTATPTNGGPGPSYQWNKNGTNVGTNSTTYTNAALVNGDVVSVAMTANNTCQTSSTANGNSITMQVDNPSVGGTSASNQILYSGQNAADMSVSGITGSVTKWQYALDNVFTSASDLAIANSTLLGNQLGPLTQTTYVRAVVNNGTCTPANSSYITISVTQALPIELLYLKGKYNGEGNLIEWSTATEQNNDYFTLLWSDNGFEFLSIMKIPGAGNSITTIKYEYLDENPSRGVNYYTLRQTDYDGKYKDSEIISVQSDRDSEKIIVNCTNVLGQKVGIDEKGVVLLTIRRGNFEYVVKKVNE